MVLAAELLVPPLVVQVFPRLPQQVLQVLVQRLPHQELEPLPRLVLVLPSWLQLSLQEPFWLLPSLLVFRRHHQWHRQLKLQQLSLQEPSSLLLSSLAFLLLVGRHERGHRALRDDELGRPVHLPLSMRSP